MHNLCWEFLGVIYNICLGVVDHKKERKKNISRFQTEKKIKKANDAGFAKLKTRDLKQLQGNCKGG